MRKSYIEALVLAADTLQRTRQPTVQRFKNALQLTSHASRSALPEADVLKISEREVIFMKQASPGAYDCQRL